MAQVRWINNLSGVLYYLNVPLLDFEIKDRRLNRAIDLNDGKLFPPELACFGISYGNLNDFFARRTIEEGCMYYREHLSAYGMECFDFDQYIISHNGNNNLDNYWVKFDGFGANSFEEICTQDYPIIDNSLR